MSTNDVGLASPPTPPALQAKLTPYKQGQLDPLCGLYSTINAVRWALGPKQLTKAQSKWLFSQLLMYVARSRERRPILAEGMSSEEILDVLKYAGRELPHILGSSMRLKTKVRRVGSKHFYAAASYACGELSAVILDISKPSEHWSVLRACQGDRIILFDSDGMAPIKFDCVRGRQFIHMTLEKGEG